MEFEAVDEGKIAKILVPEGTDGVKVGAPIAIMAGEGEDASAPRAAPKADTRRAAPPKARARAQGRRDSGGAAASAGRNARRSASARRRAARRGRTDQGVAARAPARAGAGHRPRRRSRAAARAGGSSAPTSARPPAASPLRAAPAAAAAPVATHLVTPGPFEEDIPHEAVKLSNIRKTIARRLTESKQQIPHIYLTVDIQLDALLKLRCELNQGLESRSIKLSVNDLMIKALAMALIEVPECNVSFAGDTSVQIQPRRHFGRGVDPGRADHPDRRRRRRQERVGDRDRDPRPRRAGQGGQAPARRNIRAAPRASRNMGMYGIKKFEAVINPPQGMIMAIGAGEKRPYVIND